MKGRIEEQEDRGDHQWHESRAAMLRVWASSPCDTRPAGALHGSSAASSSPRLTWGQLAQGDTQGEAARLARRAVIGGAVELFDVFLKGLPPSVARTVRSMVRTPAEVSRKRRILNRSRHALAQVSISCDRVVEQVSREIPIMKMN
ncbi:unnamed protein product [Prorocentrum cordatum]|uniref:Uncharacterized protein n=1 Tax=Prorocentrum cordatum TaxID=2364126 RepID=A0ABN9S6F8_9DINO|nr:unnamed protein product [Polarella glacialis]